MIGGLVLIVAAVWLPLSVLMAVACAAIGRAGHREDEELGYLSDAFHKSLHRSSGR